MQDHFHILNMLQPFLKFCNDCVPSQCCMQAHVWCSPDVLTQEVLVPEASEFDEWEPAGAALEGPVTAIIPTWKMLTTLDLSHNSISEINAFLTHIPKIEFLDLSHNGVLVVDNLQVIHVIGNHRCLHASHDPPPTILAGFRRQMQPWAFGHPLGFLS